MRRAALRRHFPSLRRPYLQLRRALLPSYALKLLLPRLIAFRLDSRILHQMDPQTAGLLVPVTALTHPFHHFLGGRLSLGITPYSL